MRIVFPRSRVAPARQGARGTSLLGKIGLRRKGKPVLLPVVEQPAAFAEAFGMVIRDPFYEWDRHEAYPDATNYPFLAEMAFNLYSAGVRWVRIEFHAEEGEEGGSIDYRKYDWFINTLAPRFGFKILAVFDTGILTGPGSEVAALQDPERSDGYISAFARRVEEIARRYGTGLHAYEILNEPNKHGTLARETRGAQDEIEPDAIGALMCTVFPRLKAVQPAPVLVGGLLAATNAVSGRDAPGYLTAVYEGLAARAFRSAQKRCPWDAIGLHPYPDSEDGDNSAEEVMAHLDAAYEVMRAHGDTGTIWVTTVGLQAGAPPAGDEASEGEIRQANFLNEVYRASLETRRAFVERLFWFKYADFRAAQDDSWGLVRLASSGPGDYDPAGLVARRRLAFEVYSALTPGPAPIKATPPLAPTNLQVETRRRGASFRWEAALPTTFRVQEHQLFRSTQPDMHDAVHVASVEQGRSVDIRAARGTHYYALRALDSAVPPNVSAFSNVVKVKRRI